MAKRRLFKNWTHSEKVNLLTAEEERFFTRLIMEADDHGLFYAHPKILKANLFPLISDKITDEEVESWLTGCEHIGLLEVYSADNKQYLHIHDFGQRLRSMKSTFPTPGGQMLTNDSEPPPEVEVEVEVEREIEAIVCALNQITGSSYRPKTKSTRKFILARLNEKYTIDDFKKVITVKFIEWGADQKMKNYLRPETLFGNRFESYLQQTVIKHEPIITEQQAGQPRKTDHNSNKASVTALGDSARKILSDTSSFQLKTGD